MGKKTNSGEEINEALGVEDFHADLSMGKVEVYKCKVRHIGLITALTNGIFEDLGIRDLSGLPKANIDNPQVWLKLISNHWDKAQQLIAGLCSLTEDEVEDMDLEDGQALVTKLWEVNSRFFSKVVKQINEQKVARSSGGALGEAASRTKQGH